MGSWIIFLLLFCCNNRTACNDCDNGCTCDNVRRNNDCGCDTVNARNRDFDDDCVCDRRDERDCGCDRRDERSYDCDRRDSRREDRWDNGPVWTRTNYTNGDTCGCEEK